jgi:trimeric autotransporter adhesin
LVAGLKKLPLDFHPGFQENQEKKETYMSKNLTRKGLALGAVVALGTSLFASAPAQAASVLFAPTTGTGNTLVAGDTFSLTASLSSDLPASNASQLKFKVTNTTGVATSLVTLNNLTITGNVTGALATPVSYTTSGSTSLSNVWATAPAAGTSAVFGLGGAYGTQNAGVSVAGNPTSIQIASTSATTANYTVVAFLDANNNGVLDPGELSTSQDVHFVKIADSGITTTLSQPTVGQTTRKAVVSFGSDVNVSELNHNNYAVAFGYYQTQGKTAETGTTFASQNVGTTVDAYDSVNHPGQLIANLSSGATAGASSTSYSAQAVFAGALVGNESIVSLGSTQADSNTTGLAPATGDNVAKVTAAVSSANDTNPSHPGVTGAYNVRTGTKSADLQLTVKYNPNSLTTAPAVGAGVAVAYKVNSFTAGLNSSSVADVITVNGVALTTTNVNAGISGTVLTDANGVATIPVSAAAGTAGDVVSVTAVPVNAAANVATTTVLTWANATLLAPIDLSVGANVHTVVKGGTYTASYALVDSYHALYSGSAYRIRFYEPGAPGSSPAATPNTVYVPFVNGIANVSVADNSLVTGTNAATITVEKQVNGAWVTPDNSVNYVNGSANPVDAALVTYNSNSSATNGTGFTVLAAAPVAASVSATATNNHLSNNTATKVSASVDTADTFATVNLETAYNSTVPALSLTADDAIKTTINGTVADANGVGISGAQVTISAPGIQFVQVGSPSVYSVDSITVTAGTNGAYSVDVYSHAAGSTVFTVTSGAATKTATVVYTGVTTVSNAAKLVVTGPTTSQAARAATFSAKVTDKFGNPVSGFALKATVNGVGSFAGSPAADGSVALSTGTDGTVSIKVLFASNDLGDAVVTFADATLQTTPLTSVASTISVGATDAQIDIVNNRVTATASFTAGKTVAFYVDGIKKWSKLSSSDADLVVNSNLKKGTHTVSVKISGGFVTTEKFIVK